MIDRNSKEYKALSERYGVDMAEHMSLQAEKRRYSEAVEQHREFEAKKNEDRRIRERYGNEIADEFIKLEIEGKKKDADFKAMYANIPDRHGNYFSELTDAINDEVSQDKADKICEGIKAEYRKDYNFICIGIETKVTNEMHNLKPLSDDSKMIALKIAMDLLQERYKDYFSK